MVVGRCAYRCNGREYDSYFQQQVGRGLSTFIGGGGGGLRGNGFGSVLNGLFRSVVPLLKQGGKALLREGGRTGLDFAQDLLEGKNIKTAAKTRAKQAGKRLFQQAVGHVTGGTSQRAKRIKRTVDAKPSQKSRKRGKAKVNRSAGGRDIFG